MAKNSVLDYSNIPDNNTDMGGIGIQGTSAVNNFDNAFRTFMSQIAKWTDGSTIASGATTDLSTVEGNPPEVLPPITKRQLRLTLVRIGIALSTVEAAIASMPEGLPKEEAKIEWADASTFNRDHPTLLLIASALGLTKAQVDAMWREAVTA